MYWFDTCKTPILIWNIELLIKCCCFLAWPFGNFLQLNIKIILYWLTKGTDYFFIAQIAEIVEQFGGRVHINNLWKFIYYCFVEFGNCLVFWEWVKGGGVRSRGEGFFGDFISIVLIFYCSSGKKSKWYTLLRYIFSITNERSKNTRKAVLIHM